MAYEREQQEALHLLQAIENGSQPTSNIAHLIDEADPALVYLIFTWLRSRYGGGHPAAEGVLGRLVEVTNAHSSVNAKLREGKADSIVEWFEEEHSYRDLDATEFIAIVVDKLES
jgi:hypothetical protein